MITTDNSDTTFAEDMLYMQMLVQRIFRTATDRHLDLSYLGERVGLFVRDGEVIKGKHSSIPAAQALAAGKLESRPRDRNGRFVKAERNGGSP